MCADQQMTTCVHTDRHADMTTRMEFCVMGGHGSMRDEVIEIRRDGGESRGDGSGGSGSSGGMAGYLTGVL